MFTELDSCKYYGLKKKLNIELVSNIKINNITQYTSGCFKFLMSLKLFQY